MSEIVRTIETENLTDRELARGCTWLCGMCNAGRTEADRCYHPHGICKSCAIVDLTERSIGLQLERDTLRARVARLEAALRVYANETNWVVPINKLGAIYGEPFLNPSKYAHAYGVMPWTIAQEALKGEE